MTVLFAAARTHDDVFVDRRARLVEVLDEVEQAVAEAVGLFPVVAFGVGVALVTQDDRQEYPLTNLRLPLKTVILSSLANPINVIPCSLARSTARVLGAPTAMKIGKPALRAF